MTIQRDSSALVLRYRLPALLCALAVLVCALLSHPYVNMGVSDDGPYILVAQTLARTGHITYNGWVAPMLGWQLYLGAAFIRLFGFSFTIVRSCTLIVAAAVAFLLQRTLVHANISERNATIGTLALVLSPLYLILSVTYMTDMFGLFAIVLCLYGCMRALQATTDRTAIAWLCFAVVANAICGTARQIAWLGILVMVPSTLWLLRTRRRVFLPGAAATIAAALFIFACMHWFKQQPYTLPDDLHLKSFSVPVALGQLTYFFLDGPLLLLAITILFFPEIRRSRPAVVITLSVLLLGYLFLALYPSRLRGSFPLHPAGEWVNATAIFAYPMLQGTPLLFLHPAVRAFLTVATIGALFGLILSLARARKPTLPDASATSPGINSGGSSVPSPSRISFFSLPAAQPLVFMTAIFSGCCSSPPSVSSASTRNASSPGCPPSPFSWLGSPRSIASL
jgi:hypothetical protein